eukprot:2843343-Pleurochrysis_carterae.AAC.2
MAPELWGLNETHIVRPSVDIWAMGVVAYLLLSGRLPFHGKTNAEVRAAQVEYMVPQGLSRWK